MAPVRSSPKPDADADDRSALKGVTVDDGAFETTVDAADLAKAKSDGESVITFRDSNGDEETTVFTVTGTTTLGSDSVGKGKLLEIGISDWIALVPDLVRIDGERSPSWMKTEILTRWISTVIMQTPST